MKLSLLACLCTIVMGSLAWSAAPTITGFTPANGLDGTMARPLQVLFQSGLRPQPNRRMTELSVITGY